MVPRNSSVLFHHRCAILSPVCFFIIRMLFYNPCVMLPPVCYFIIRVLYYHPCVILSPVPYGSHSAPGRPSVARGSGLRFVICSRWKRFPVELVVRPREECLISIFVTCAPPPPLPAIYFFNALSMPFPVPWLSRRRARWWRRERGSWKSCNAPERWGFF